MDCEAEFEYQLSIRSRIKTDITEVLVKLV